MQQLEISGNKNNREIFLGHEGSEASLIWHILSVIELPPSTEMEYLVDNKVEICIIMFQREEEYYDILSKLERY